MNIIKFSHPYTKLNNIQTSDPVTLLLAIRTHYTKLSPHYIEYDAVYDEPIKDGYGHTTDTKKAYYPVPCKPLILLIFQDIRGNIFTTLRRHTPRKLDNYQLNVGHTYTLVEVSS